MYKQHSYPGHRHTFYVQPPLLRCHAPLAPSFHPHMASKKLLDSFIKVEKLLAPKCVSYAQRPLFGLWSVLLPIDTDLTSQICLLENVISAFFHRIQLQYVGLEDRSRRSSIDAVKTAYQATVALDRFQFMKRCHVSDHTMYLIDLNAASKTCSPNSAGI